MAVAARELETADVAYLREGFQGELPAAIHRHGGKKAAGAFTSGFQRLLDDRFIRYFIEYEVDDHGIPYVGEDGKFIPKRDERGQFVRYRVGDEDDWVMPVHEALKRYRGDRKHPRLEYVWLKALLTWRGLPFQCEAHQQTIRTFDEIIECFARRDHTTSERIVVGIKSAAASTWRIIETHQDQVAARRLAGPKAWPNTERENYKPRRTSSADVFARYPRVDNLLAAKLAGHKHRLKGATYPQGGTNGS